MQSQEAKDELCIELSVGQVISVRATSSAVVYLYRV